MSPWWSLIFVILGGFVSTGTAYFLDKVRRRDQRRDKWDDAKRNALARALAWIDPMDRALISAEIEIYALLSGSQDEREFRKRYPNLIAELSDLDLSPEQRLVLDDELYPLGHQIRKGVEDLKYDAIKAKGETEYPVHAPALSVVDARYNATIRVKELRERVESLRRRLAEDFRQTYQ